MSQRSTTSVSSSGQWDLFREMKEMSERMKLTEVSSKPEEGKTNKDESKSKEKKSHSQESGGESSKEPAPEVNVEEKSQEKSEEGSKRSSGTSISLSEDIAQSDVAAAAAASQKSDNSEKLPSPQEEDETSQSNRREPFKVKPMIVMRSTYWKSRRLAEGAYGNVYLVRHRDSQAFRAAKYQKNLSAEALEQVREEARILSNMDHKHVVDFVEYFEERTLRTEKCHRAVLVTEFLDSGELFDLISQKGYTLSEAKCRTIFTQILKGVDYIHSQGIIHLDLKSENILMAKTSSGDGRGRKLKIIDFGLAVDVNRVPEAELEEPASESGPARVTITEMKGTLEMMAPEVMGRSHASTASDMWSLGVVLYMLLSGGVSPFWAGSEKRTQGRILKGVYDLNTPNMRNISSTGINLLRGLLEVRDRNRHSAARCLEHPWVKYPIGRGGESAVVNTDVMRASFIKRKWKRTLEVESRK